MTTNLSHTPRARVGQPSDNSIPPFDEKSNPKTKKTSDGTKYDLSENDEIAPSKLSTTQERLTDIFLGLGVKEGKIPEHVSLMDEEEIKRALDARKKAEKEKKSIEREKRRRPRVYRKKEAEATIC